MGASRKQLTWPVHCLREECECFKLMTSSSHLLQTSRRHETLGGRRSVRKLSLTSKLWAATLWWGTANPPASGTNKHTETQCLDCIHNQLLITLFFYMCLCVHSEEVCILSASGTAAILSSRFMQDTSLDVEHRLSRQPVVFTSGADRVEGDMGSSASLG